MTITDPRADHPPAEVIIGVDVGTTAAKVSAFGLSSPWRHTEVREYPLLHPNPGWEVQDPATIASATLGALTDCVTRCGSAQVIALVLSSAMHGLIGLDRDMKPLTPLLTWADSRAADEATQLRASEQGPRLQQRSGTPVHSMSPLTKLMWFARHEPDLCRQVRYWVGLKDHGIQTLTGTLATELSCASGTGMLDLTTGDWNPEAIELAGVRRDQLPDVLPTTAALGLRKSVASRVGLPTATPVITGAGDGPLGNLGTGALGGGVVGLSLGTSGALRMIIDRPYVDPGGTLFCYALTDRDWVVGGPVSNGGLVVRWAGQVFGKDLRAGESGSVDADLLALARSIPIGSDGLVFLPYLMAERAPLWDPTIPGAFLGVRHGHTRGHFIRAAVEGVALQLSTILHEIDRIDPVTAIRATGGVFRSSLWTTILAGMLARPLTVTGGAEGSALGAAALGLYALGRAPDLRSALTMLDAENEVDDVTVVADPAEVAAYEMVRASVPALIDQLRPVGRVFGAT